MRAWTFTHSIEAKGDDMPAPRDRYRQRARICTSKRQSFRKIVGSCGIRMHGLRSSSRCEASGHAENDTTAITTGGAIAALRWEAVPDPSVLGYRLYVGTAPHTYQWQLDVGLTTRHVILNPQHDTAYYVAVTAYNCFGESAYSEEVRVFSH